jgi:hypothetical protein
VREQEQIIGQIRSLVEQEAASHEALLHTLEEEWSCLRNHDPLSLASLLPTKEALLQEIRKIRTALQELLPAPSRNPDARSIDSALRNLAGLLDPAEAKRIKQCQETTGRLRKQIHYLNDRNKRFLQETVNFITDLFSLVTGTVHEEVSYAREGKTRRGMSPSLVSREV